MTSLDNPKLDIIVLVLCYYKDKTFDKVTFLSVDRLRSWDNFCIRPYSCELFLITYRWPHQKWCGGL